MHPSELTADEREHFERVMEIVHEMDDDERTAMIGHAVAAIIRHRTSGGADVLEDWVAGVVATVRLYDIKAVREALREHRRPPLVGTDATGRELLAALRR